jgi:hypothetical protein
MKGAGACLRYAETLNLVRVAEHNESMRAKHLL